MRHSGQMQAARGQEELVATRENRRFFFKFETNPSKPSSVKREDASEQSSTATSSKRTRKIKEADMVVVPYILVRRAAANLHFQVPEQQGVPWCRYRVATPFKEAFTIQYGLQEARAEGRLFCQDCLLQLPAEQRRFLLGKD